MKTRAKRRVLLVALGLAACVLMGCAAKNNDGPLPAIEVQPDPGDDNCMIAARADLNGDGMYEEYRGYSLGHGIVTLEVFAYDENSGVSYRLGDQCVTDYYLVLYQQELYVVSMPYHTAWTAEIAIVSRPALDEENQEILLTEVTGELAEQVLNALWSWWGLDAA